jgi:hypothetical protein
VHTHTHTHTHKHTRTHVHTYAHKHTHKHTQTQPGKKLTEQEQWEAQQLKASGVLATDELPTYDEESGVWL